MRKKIFILLLIIFISYFSLAQNLTGDGTALVLSGGGARGAYEIGAWKALCDLGINITGVYGTSVGSINGSGIVMEDFKKARDLWFKISYLNVMNISPEAEDLMKGDFRDLTFEEYRKIIRNFRTNKGIDVTPLKKLLSGIISEDKVRQSGIDYGLSMFSVSDLKPLMLYIEQIPRGELIDYILASANFPLFKRQVIKGDVFIDGGVYSNVPVEMAIKRGFKDIIVVDIGISTPVDIINHFRLNNDASIKYTYIKPERQFGSFLTFEPEISRKYLLEGYLDTMRVYKRLSGEKYYIYGGTGDLIRKMFDSLSMEKQKAALMSLGIERIKITAGDLYTSSAVPYLRKVLLVPGNSITDNISLTVLEKLAEKMEVDQLNVYTQQGLIGEIIKRHKNSPKDTSVTGFLKELRYGKVLNFLEYLNNNARPGKKIPEGYGSFLKQFRVLVEE